MQYFIEKKKQREHDLLMLKMENRADALKLPELERKPHPVTTRNPFTRIQEVSLLAFSYYCI